MAEAVLRPARPDDAAALGATHVQAWQESYRGILADGYLDRLSVRRRVRQWRRALAVPQPRIAVLVLEDAAGIAGFGMIGPQREPERAAEAELYALYLLRRQQGRGWGRRLFGQLAAGAAAWGARSLDLWVLTANAPAVGFYAALGGIPGAERDFRIARRRVTERAYDWPAIAAIAGPARQ